MMTKNQINEREQMEMLTIEQLVPQDHLVRKLDAAIDFSFIYPLVEDLYSTVGRHSIDPVVLIKMTFSTYQLILKIVSSAGFREEILNRKGDISFKIERNVASFN